MLPLPLFVRLLCLFATLAVPAGAVPRLAIVSDPACRVAADLLLARMNGNSAFELVERDRLDLVLAEQKLGTWVEDPGAAIRAGGLMHAHGLLFLGEERRGSQRLRVLRFSAVEAGVVLHTSVEPAPDAAGEAEWARRAAPRMEGLARRLSLKRNQLIPFSLLNFRHELGGAGPAALEREFTSLLERSLVENPEVVLLERSRLDALELERLCRWDFAHGHLWTCGALIEGSLSAGVGTNLLSVAAYLNPPGGGAPGKVELSTRPDALPEAAARCARLLVDLHRKSAAASCWTPEAEGLRFLTEAKSAMDAGLHQDAAAAAEVARVLGVKSEELDVLRVSAHSRAAYPLLGKKTALSLNGGREFYRTPQILPWHTLRAVEAFQDRMEGLKWDGKRIFRPRESGDRQVYWFSTLACWMALRLNLPDLPPELREWEPRVSQALTDTFGRLMKAAEEVPEADRLPLNYEENGVRLQNRFWNHYALWQSVVMEHAPAWTPNAAATREYYQRVLRMGFFVTESAASDCLSRLGVVDSPGQPFRNLAPSSCISQLIFSEQGQARYPLFLDKRTGNPDVEASKAWSEELRRDTNLVARAATSRAALFEWQGDVQRRRQKVIDDYNLRNNPGIDLDKLYGRNQPSAAKAEGPPGRVPVLAAPYWSPPLDRLVPRPNPEYLLTLDMRLGAREDWYLVSELKIPRSFLSTSPGLHPQNWWLVRQPHDGGESQVVPLSTVGASLSANPGSCWTTDGTTVVAANALLVVAHDLATGTSKSIPTGVRCQWPVLQGRWAYFAFQGESSGLLRVHLDDERVEILASSRRKPALTPHDDKAAYYVGPGFPAPDGSVAYLGAWTPPPANYFPSDLSLLHIEGPDARLVSRPAAFPRFGSADDLRMARSVRFTPYADHWFLGAEELVCLAGRPDKIRTLVRWENGSAFGQPEKAAFPHPKSHSNLRWPHAYHERELLAFTHEPNTPEDQCELVYAPPKSQDFQLLRVGFTDVVQPGLAWGFPRRLTAGPHEVFLHAGQQFGYDHVCDPRVWRVDREQFAKPALSPKELADASRRQLLLSPLARAVGLPAAEAARALKESGVLTDATLAPPTNTGDELRHVFAREGVLLFSRADRVVRVACVTANQERGWDGFRGTLPMGLAWSDTHLHAQGKLGAPTAAGKAGNAPVTVRTYEFGDLTLRVFFKLRTDTVPWQAREMAEVQISPTGA